MPCRVKACFFLRLGRGLAEMIRPSKNKPIAATGKPAASPQKPRRWRLWGFRLAAMILSPVLFFVLLEGSLRLTDFGHPTTFFLHRSVNGQRVLIENKQFGWRFFGPALARTPYPLVLPEAKPPGTIRIFVFGESAAYGEPEPNFGLPRVLSALLQARYPDARFEVVNTAMTAINSHVILPIARECAEKNGDIWVIYMGNNEVIGPFGSGTIFSRQAPGLAVINASLALKTTRTGQLLDGLMSRREGGANQPDEWRGLMMFARNQVRQDDPRMTRVYSNFARNLSEMLAAGVKHQARIVVSTVASNLRDCAPFASLHRPDLTPTQRQEWDRLYQAGVEAEQSGHAAEAAALYRQAADGDDSFAEMQFRWARCCLALGHEEEARRHFVQARDTDALRFRADSRINEIIRQTASGRDKEGVLLVDAEASLSAQSPHGMLGEELLYEHVHFNFEGNYLLARTLAEQVARLLPEAVRGSSDPKRGWLSADECARRLVWTGWNRYQAMQQLRMNVPPFTYRLNHAEQVRHLEQQLERLQPALSPVALRQDAEEYRQALAAAPGDWVLYANLARLLQKLDDIPGAIGAWQQVARLLPQEETPHVNLFLLLLQSHRDEAVAEYDTAMTLDPRTTGAMLTKLLTEKADGLIKQGKYAEAIPLLQQALQFEPNFAEVHLNLGVILNLMGKTDEAEKHFRLALDHRPTTPEGLVSLGRVCATQGWGKEAISCLEDALRWNPMDAAAHYWLGDVLATTGRFAEARSHYAEAVRLQPEFAEAHCRLGVELARQGLPAQAAEQFTEAVRLKPNLPEAHLQWGILLFSQQKDADALIHFQEVLRLDPTNAEAKARLQAVQADLPVQ